MILGGIGAIALIVSASSVLAVTLASVTQRRREVGIRMAIGARRIDIFLQFLVEAVAIAAAGAAGGTFVGYVVAPHVGTAIDAAITLKPWFLPASMTLALVSGVAAGTVPALRAANLDLRLVLGAN